MHGNKTVAYCIYELICASLFNQTVNNLKY